jgi:NTE family protein
MELASVALRAGKQAIAPVRRRAPAPAKVLAIASLGASVAFVDATIVNIAFPAIERSFRGTSLSTLSWVLNAYNIVFAAFLLPAGRMCDLLGRRRVFVFGLVLFTVASLLCALAPSAPTLIGFRVLQALGGACVVPASLGLVLNAFAADRRAHGVALLSAFGAAAAGFGPSLGGLLVTAVSWRFVFLVNLPIGVVATVLARRELVENRAPGRRRLPDILGAMMLAAAIASFVLAEVKGPAWGWTGAGVIGCVAGAVVLLALCGIRCARHRAPIVDLSLLRVRSFSAANGMTVISAAGFYSYTLTNVLFLTGVWHYSILRAGLALTPGPFVAAATAGPTSRLAYRIGHRPVLLAGGLIWGGALLWFVARVGLTPHFLSQWLPGMLLLGLGAGALFPNLSGCAVGSAPGDAFATATGVNSVARQVGAALGVAATVAIIGTPSVLGAAEAFRHAWILAAGCMFAAGLGCVSVGSLAASIGPSFGTAARAVLTRPTAAAAPVERTAAPRARRAALQSTGSGRPESAAEFLSRVPLLAALPGDLIDSVAERASTKRVKAGDWLFRAGDPGDALYVVRAGRLQVLAETSRTDAVIRELGRGDALGELALLADEPRSASVRAARDSDLLEIDRAVFEPLLRDSPALAQALTRTLGSQLRESRGTAARMRPLPVTIALLALDDGVPLPALAAALRDELGAHARAELLDADNAPALVPGQDAASAYGSLVDRAEADNDHVLLAADLRRAGEWCAFCIQQADRIVAIASTEAARLDHSTLGVLAGCDLAGFDVPIGSGALAPLAERLAPTECHAVRSGIELDRDLARLARRLAGRSLGVVLSGGGARALAHIGVLEELERSGLVIDRVAGVSMGAYIGGMYALGMDAQEMDAHAFEELVRRRPFGDYTFPRHALIRGRRAEAMLARTFGEAAIEELPRSFFSASADLRTGELVLSRWGQLADAVGVSMCLPVIAPPQLRGNRLLIDGSLVDNLPVAAMAELAEGPIIAVDVKATFERPPRSSAEGGMSIPSLGETLTRVLLLGSANTPASARLHADLTITPRGEGIGLLEFHQLDRARQAGQAAAREALENLPDSVLV